MTQDHSRYDDGSRIVASALGGNQYSPFCDLIYYKSSVTPDLKLAMRVSKPINPGYMLVRSHGWHMSMPAFEQLDSPLSEFLIVDVDMRGRAFSDGKPDCNMLELYDIVDAAEAAKKLYPQYLVEPDVVYFEGGSGGGGNALAIAGKFPDYFSSINALYGISDYAMWYINDKVGEFRDEMDIWIGGTPNEMPSAYAARSGITTVSNLATKLFICHGETDVRVPSIHSREYARAAFEAGVSNLVTYFELKNVGTRSHTGNATKKQLSVLESMCLKSRNENRKRPSLPTAGKLVVAGYVCTQKFEIVLNDMNRVEILEYDTAAGSYEIKSLAKSEYSVNTGRYGRA